MDTITHSSINQMRNQKGRRHPLIYQTSENRIQTFAQRFGILKYEDLFRLDVLRNSYGIIWR